MVEVYEHRPRRKLARTRGGVQVSPDVERIARALAGPYDTRLWVSVGTVGYKDDRGTFIATADDAGANDPPGKPTVYADVLGPVVDVRLEPSGDFATAFWAGVGVGEYGSILVPILPGDLVVVLMPDGDLNSPSNTIVALLPCEVAQIPDDWANDTVRFDLRVPLEVRAPAVEIRAPTLRLNGRSVLPGADTI